MCGLTAFFSFGNEQIQASKFIEINNVIKHRGPDDEGYFFSNGLEDQIVLGGKDTPNEVFENQNIYHLPNKSNFENNKKYKFALGHRRLSICDISQASHQPYFEKNKKSVLIFNGEIYNHKELRSDLLKNKSMIFTKGDTEILYKLFSEKKNKALNLLNGMFAFIYFDYEKKKIYAGKDRFGVKPLYYYIKPGEYIFFASELKQFLKLPNFKNNIDRNIINDFLKYDMIESADENTIFSEVKKIEPGSINEFDISEFKKINFSKSNYYNLSFDRNKKNIDYENEFRKVFINAIKLRIPEEVSFASCLSGGIDSTLVSVILNKLFGHPINTLNFQSNLKENNEKKYYDEVIRLNKFNANFISKINTENILKDFSKVVYTQDQPFSNGSIFAEYYLYKLAKEKNFKVVLDGHGADEYFLGYDLNIVKFFNFLSKSKQLKLNSKLILYLSNKLTFLGSNKLKNRFFKNRIRSQYYNQSIESKLEFNDINRYIHFLIYNNLSKQLTMVDRNSMAFGIENRSPFMDYNVINFACNLPLEKLLNNFEKKVLIKNTFKNEIPELILRRSDKIGYSFEEKSWNSKEIEDFYFDKIKYGEKNLEINAYKELVNNFKYYKNDKNQIFKYIVLAEWHQIFSGKKEIN